MIGLWW